MNIIHIKKIGALVLGIIILVLTLLRENIFLEINAVMNGHSYNNAYFYFFDDSIVGLSMSQLALLKWGLTILFILIISGFTVVIIQLWFKNKMYNRLTILIYAVVFGVVGFVTFVLWLMNAFTDYYFVVRKMIGFLQSPLPLFLFFTMYLYLVKTSTKTQI